MGATVNGKPNFITIAHIGIMTHTHISLSMGKNLYTNAGIKENKSFSVCLPSEKLVVETDYCGIMTGKKTDKAVLFDMNRKKYWSLGGEIAQCWHIGKQLKPGKSDRTNR